MRFRLWHRLLFVVAALPATMESYAQTDSRTQRDFELGESIEVLANIMRELEVGFVDDVSAKQLLNSAARGMITATDPYSE